MGKGNRGRRGPTPQRKQPRSISVDPSQQEAPRAWNPRSQILRQMGLDQAGGVMRLVTILMHHFDPEGKGVLVDSAAMKEIILRATPEGEGRSQLQVSGQHDAIHLIMVTPEVARSVVVADNAIARQQGRPEAPLPPQAGA